MIKKILFSLLFSTAFFVTKAQVNLKAIEGDIYVIEQLENNDYKYIFTPRPNFIIKKGGFPNYESLSGEKVEIVTVKEKKDGVFIVTLKLVSGKRFFNSHKYIKANFKEAINSKELRKI